MFDKKMYSPFSQYLEHDFLKKFKNSIRQALEEDQIKSEESEALSV